MRNHTVVNADGYKCLIQSGEAKIGLFTCPIGIINYIHQNPVRAGFVEYDNEWKYGSARHYVNGMGIVKKEMLDLM